MHEARFPAGEPSGPAGRSRRAMRRTAALVAGLALLAGTAAAAASPALAVTHRPGPPHGTQPSAKVPASVNTAFRRLVTQLRDAPAKAVHPAAYRRYLISQAEAAQRSADDGADCTASATLAGLRKDLVDYRHIVAGPIRVPPGWAVEFSADVLDVQAIVQALPGAVNCGGVASGAPAAQPATAVSSATTTQVRFRVLFPAPRFTAESGGGKRYLEMRSPGMGDISALFDGKQTHQQLITPGGSAVGRPAVPGASETLAVPQGSKVSVKVTGETGYSLPAIQLWPFQEPAPASASGGGQTSGSPLPRGAFPFAVNKSAYRSRAVFPASPAIAPAPGSEHGLRTVSVSLAGGSYRPAARTLKVLTSATVVVTFTGSAKTNVFGPASLISPWDEGFQSLWQSTLLNYADVSRALTPGVPVTKFCGEQMIIITAPELETAADQYATDRSADGIDTRVFLTGSTSAGGVGTTATQIRDFIAGQYDSSCAIRPSYVLLLGDTSLVPTFEISFGLHTEGGKTVPNWFDEEDPIATDMPYGFIHQAAQVNKSLGAGKTNEITDYGQDLFVGRIPVDASGPDPEAAAMTEINSLHAYEDSPPASGSSFYGNVTGAEFFQPCPSIQTDCGRTASPPAPVTPSTQDTESFLRTSEFAGELAGAAGKTFKRVASDEANNDPGVTITPKTYDNGAAIPSGINWNGNAADITADVNAGTFLLWHSDHGYTDGSGWYEPGFGTGSVYSVSPPGTALPLVWSSDCDSGKFDSATDGSLPYTVHGTEPSFGEAWLETDHAAAFVGASRVSPIYQDGYMLDGMADNLFPELGNLFRVLLGGSPVAPVTTLGPLLDAAKVYMQQETSADMATDIGAQGTTLEYNDLGDPSMQIWRNAPSPYIARSFGAVLGAGLVTVSDSQKGTNGTVVILQINGEILGAGILANGSARIPVSTGLSSLTGVTATLVGQGFLSAVIPAGSPAGAAGGSAAG
jgi:Peptidase family C25/Propeptide_C25